MPRILIVDDDKNLAETLQAGLKQEKYLVDIVHTGEDARLQLKDDIYDLVVLDWNLPGISGVEVCRSMRVKGNTTPVLMLTAMDHIDHKDLGFELGADDYLTKPFHMRELKMRVKALLRRYKGIVSNKVLTGDLEIDLNQKRVTKKGEEVHLKPLEFRALEYFLRHPNEVITPEALLLSIWDQDSEATVDSVYICISRLRKKLGMTGKDAALRTSYGQGYCFVLPGSAQQAEVEARISEQD